jgi:hypothetical protein
VTSLQSTAPELALQEPRPSHALLRACLTGLVAGIALGVVDFAAQKTAPYLWANLANSPAIWAVVAFAVGSLGARRLVTACSAAVLTMIVAVVSYYVTAAARVDQQIDVMHATARNGDLAYQKMLFRGLDRHLESARHDLASL